FNRDQGERVSTFSVNERRALSIEGVITVGVLVDRFGNLLSGPTIEVGASGFLKSKEWQELNEELKAAVVELIHTFGEKNTDGFDPNQLRAAIRDLVAKTIRSRLQAKPAVQIIVH